MAGIPAASAGEAARTDESRSGFESVILVREQAVAPVCGPSGHAPAGFARRIGATLYESVVLAALLIALGFVLLPIVTPSATVPSPRLYALSPVARVFSGTVLLAACAAYFGWLWSGNRRTLAMRTWRLALVTTEGTPVRAPRALLRFAACVSGLAASVPLFAWLEPSGHGRWAAAALALNYAWAFIDRDRAFLHDRIAGTRLVLRP